jgi:hypothetical protein
MGVPYSPPDMAPDYFGLVAGVRAWRVANTLWAKMGGWLWSFSMLDCWRPPSVEEWKEAECKIGHRIPGDDCDCGIWAFFEPEMMAQYVSPVPRAVDRFEYVSGIVGAGGDIVEHELGFRAQYVKVLAIFDDDYPTPKDEIATMYDCPIIERDSYDAFCADHNLIRLDQQ